MNQTLCAIELCLIKPRFETRGPKNLLFTHDATGPLDKLNVWIYEVVCKLSKYP